MPNTVPAAATGLPDAIRNIIGTSLLPDDMPETYALICEGNCLHPLVKSGTKLLFSRDQQYMPDDLVCLILRPEFVRPGGHQLLVKKLVFAPPHRFWADPSCNAGSNIVPAVIVEMLNPRKMLQISPAALLGIHKCLGPVPKGRKTYRVSDDEVRATAGASIAYTPADMEKAASWLKAGESRGEKFAWDPAPFTYWWTTPEGRRLSCTITDPNEKPVAEAMRALLKAREAANG